MVYPLVYLCFFDTVGCKEFPNESNPASKVGTFEISSIVKGAYTFWVRALEDGKGYRVVRYFDLQSNNSKYKNRFRYRK